MKTCRRFAVLFLLSTFSLAWAQPEVPRLKYSERTLANGLRVYGIEDHFSPTVSVQVWYHVGSKDDPDGRSGFAHLFEHMLFKATKNMPSEMLDRLTEDVGGENNAYTADDRTVYHENIPSNYLETLIWAEAERMASLIVDEPNFKSERDVVKEEFRQNYVARPYGKLYLLMSQRSWLVHPYKRPGIGNIEELDASTLPDVVKFHQTYYRPDNASLIVAGDFDPKQYDAWVDKYFGKVQKPATEIPRVTVREPARTAERRYVEHDENVPLPAVMVTYLMPPAASEEMFPLKVLQALLTEGTSSRLYHALVYEQQVAQSVESFLDRGEDAGLLVVNVTLAGGKTVDEGERALLAELEKLQSAPVTAAELDKAKTKLLADWVRGRETNEDKAGALGEAVVLLGDATRVNTDIERLQKVSAEDVQRAAKATLAATNRVVIHYLPAEEKKDEAAASDDKKSGQ